MEERIVKYLYTLWKLGYDTSKLTLIVKSTDVLTGDSRKVDVIDYDFGSFRVQENKSLTEDEFVVIGV